MQIMQIIRKLNMFPKCPGRNRTPHMQESLHPGMFPLLAQIQDMERPCVRLYDRESVA